MEIEIKFEKIKILKFRLSYKDFKKSFENIPVIKRNSDKENTL